MARYTACCLLGVILLHIVSSQDRPNLIVIVADDLGWNDVGFHGSTQLRTPNLDALAYDGVILADYYVQQLCTPSRSALMTGRYPIHTGLQSGVIPSQSPYGLGLNETIFPQYLKELGYSTHMVGKWHLGFYAKELTPVYRGFDSFFGFLGGKGDYWDHTNQEGSTKATWGLDLYANLTVVKTAYGDYSTALFTRRAVDVIHATAASQQPLFLYLPHQAIHSGNNVTPLEAPWADLERFPNISHKGRRTVAAMVSALDDGVGAVVQALADTGRLNNSIILFTTDNGGPAAGYDGNYANNFPLRGMKNTLWEGGQRATGFLWSPLIRQPRRHAGQMVHVTDWLPTLLSAVGYDISKLANRSLDGIDQWQELSENLPAKRTEIMHNIDPQGQKEQWALRMGDYKLVFCDKGRGGWYPPEGEEEEASPGPPSPHSTPSTVGSLLRRLGRLGPVSPAPLRVDCGPRPANVSTGACHGEPCLFDVRRDPCEYSNIADQHPEIVESMRARVKFYRAGMVRPKNVPGDPQGLPGNRGGIWGPWRDAPYAGEL